jgi:hypothetical protein
VRRRLTQALGAKDEPLENYKIWNRWPFICSGAFGARYTSGRAPDDLG